MKDLRGLALALHWVEKLKLTGVEDSRTLTAEHGANIRLTFELSTNKDTPIQAVLSVNTNGRNVWRWGALDQTESNQMAIWFQKMYETARNIQENTTEEQKRTIQQIIAVR